MEWTCRREESSFWRRNAGGCHEHRGGLVVLRHGTVPQLFGIANRVAHEDEQVSTRGAHGSGLCKDLDVHCAGETGILI